MLTRARVRNGNRRRAPSPIYPLWAHLEPETEVLSSKVCSSPCTVRTERTQRTSEGSATKSSRLLGGILHTFATRSLRTRAQILWAWFSVLTWSTPAHKAARCARPFSRLTMLPLRSSSRDSAPTSPNFVTTCASTATCWTLMFWPHSNAVSASWAISRSPSWQATSGVQVGGLGFLTVQSLARPAFIAGCIILAPWFPSHRSSLHTPHARTDLPSVWVSNRTSSLASRSIPRG